MVVLATLDDLIRRADRLASGDGTTKRQLLGIVGPPGSGKSTIAELVASALGDRAVVVPMDGFHLAQRELERLGRTDRKGAFDTFDGDGFAALVDRLAGNTDEVVYAPAFERSIDEPIAGAIAVSRRVPLVIVEGNYLLVPSDPWTRVATSLSESWYVSAGEDERMARLIARHEQFGRDPADARRHAWGSDQRNAELVATTADRANVIVELADDLLAGRRAGDGHTR